MDEKYANDVKEILSHRYDNGADLWTTPDERLLKGAPFDTIDSALYLLELGISKDDEIIKQVADLIFSKWREDGRFKLYPSGGIYPCQSARGLSTLCAMGYEKDQRIQTSLQYFLDTQEEDGGWKCNKYSFGKGPETEYSTPNTTLLVLDAMRHTSLVNHKPLEKAVNFLLEHWTIKKPISPCHYGIGTLFKKVSYPFRDYNIFYYVYVLSFYDCAKHDKRFLEALDLIKSKLVNDQIVVERVVPKLAKLSFCKKGEVSELASKRYQEILCNIGELEK